MKPGFALALDTVCWTGATFVALIWGYPTIAAMIGAFGILYLYKAFIRYYYMRVAEAQWNEFARSIEAAKREGRVIQTLEVELENEEELERILHRFRHDPEGLFREFEKRSRKEETGDE